MSAPLLPISVVIPTYGRAEYLVAAIDSLWSGAASPREIIVVDDGSPDDTAARLAPLIRERRIHYHRQANAGMAAARNAGAALATSRYLYFLDDDDLALPDGLAALSAELDAHSGAQIACGEMVIFSGEPPHPPCAPRTARDVDRRQFLRFNPVGSSGQVLLRRESFLAGGGYHSGFPAVEDWDLWLRLVEPHPARWLNGAVMAYRVHERNTSRNIVRMNNSSLRVARRHLARLPASDRTLARYFTYRALRQYHAPRLMRMLQETSRRHEWRLASAAAREWAASSAMDAWATVRLKAHLAAHGRSRLLAEEQLP